jgi:glycosyltransferase involved in cell wall biosynthesis
MNICFLDKTEFSYTSENRFDSNLRGAENTLINLSIELNKLGHNVTIFNNNNANRKIKNIDWININKLNSSNYNFDIAFSNNDCNFFKLINAKKNVLISYSLQNLEKFIRKKQLISYIKYKPKIVTLGKYHSNNRSKLLSLFGSIEINLAVDDIFFNTRINNFYDEDMAMFNSRTDRNMNLLLDIWINYIHPYNSKAKLLVTPDFNLNIKNKSIRFRKMLHKNDYIKDLLKSKIVLLPGHKAELYCLAAEEARELCIPIVTLGIGSLSERVEHEKTGFIAKNQKDFGKYTLELFKDAKVWNRIRNNLIDLRASKTWAHTAKSLLLEI